MRFLYIMIFTLFCLSVTAQDKYKYTIDISHLFDENEKDTIYTINLQVVAQDFPLKYYYFAIDTQKEELKQIECRRITLNHDNFNLSCYGDPPFPAGNLLLIFRIYDLSFNENIPILVNKYFQLEYSIGDKMYIKKFYVIIHNETYNSE